MFCKPIVRLQRFHLSYDNDIHVHSNDFPTTYRVLPTHLRRNGNLLQAALPLTSHCYLAVVDYKCVAVCIIPRWHLSASAAGITVCTRTHTIHQQFRWANDKPFLVYRGSQRCRCLQNTETHNKKHLIELSEEESNRFPINDTDWSY